MTVKTLIGILVVFAVAGFIAYAVIVEAHKTEQQQADEQAAAQRQVTALNYNHVICDNGFETSKDHSLESNDKYEVDLPSGCFSMFITLPLEWHRWSYQHAPGVKNGWVAFWYPGGQPSKPMPIDDDGSNPYNEAGNKFRVQGKGKIIFFRTDK